ncbi:hypothetical protein EVA_21316 [gut metagenome]|uniref:Uncharacterized protein n=1 Tax=gut metagenome TaxID=749906 RepID=J9BSR4_9ZZZZ
MIFSPTKVLRTKSTPSSSIRLISLRTTAFGRRYWGMPYIKTPPGSSCPSKMVTWKPLRARTPATVSPAGPEPITATLPRFFATSFSRVSCTSASKSAMKDSSFPIRMGASFLLRMQCPSHCFSWGHTLPQMAGRLLFSLMMFIASPILPRESWWMKSGIWLPMGQPVTHKGFLQCRQRLASATASRIVNCCSTTLKALRSSLFIFPKN